MSELRLVSVLFADLVGFTALSEGRDSEEVRDLLSRYFETCKQLIGRYGGTVEKFIGDAVMAVWGTPVAREDDAERAVRTAIDLTAAVAALGAEVGSVDLKARAAVLTGEASVTIGAEGQGMVAGDLVNTASRIQSLASPGEVFVGESTKRVTEAAILYEDEGAQEVKGKAEPVQVWRAVRVTAGRGGALKSSGLEAPFVGRDRELRVVKELFHASIEERKARLISVTGIAGIGKSRLVWEFFKYIDGLADLVAWHRGRCLSYGEGVTYWALAEMVRTRCNIAEEEEVTSALEKLHTAVTDYVPDAEEQKWAEPRLAHLLGLEERSARDREDLFSAWRLFFERVAERSPVVMVFEDLQWADTSLLEFVEYLLDWSRNHPVFIMTLARPEVADRHPNWAAGKRNFTSLYLEPLSSKAMNDLMEGLVPGLPLEIRASILERAEGVPLYAVETVRMLIDRGLLVRDADAYRVVGEITSLEVPDSLHSLIAARLDALPLEERTLLQDASVLGKTFTKPGLAELTGCGAENLDRMLGALTRKEFITLHADPRSPERGQYGFLQDIVKRVAYETLSKKERKMRHLAVAEYLERTWRSEDDEIVEVVAAHYLDAYQQAPTAPDGPDIKTKARGMLVRAGERAASLAASVEAARYFEQAADLADDGFGRAELLERAGDKAWSGGQRERAKGLFEEALALFSADGKTHPAARVTARLGEVIREEGRHDEAIAQMERAFAVLAADEPDESVAMLAAQIARISYLMGNLVLASDRVEFALKVAESLWLPHVLSDALNTKASVLVSGGHPEEGLGLMNHALAIARDNDLAYPLLRALNNLSYIHGMRDRYEDVLTVAGEGVTTARKYGHRFWERFLMDGHLGAMVFTGRWDEALTFNEEAAKLDDVGPSRIDRLEHLFLLLIYLARGQMDEARETLDLYAEVEHGLDAQARSAYAVGKAAILRVEGKYTDALIAAEHAIADEQVLAPGHPTIKEGYVEALEAALALSEVDVAQRLLDHLDALSPGDIPPYLRAQASRFHARVAELSGRDDMVEPGYKAAAGLLRELGIPFPEAITLLEHGEYLVKAGRANQAEPLLKASRAIFERLKATPWLERLDHSVQSISAGV